MELPFMSTYRDGPLWDLLARVVGYRAPRGEMRGHRTPLKRVLSARGLNAWAPTEYQRASFLGRCWRKKSWMKGPRRWWRALKGIENRIGCASSEWRTSFTKATCFFSFATLLLADGQLKRHPVVFFCPPAVRAGISDWCDCRSNLHFTETFLQIGKSWNAHSLCV